MPRGAWPALGTASVIFLAFVPVVGLAEGPYSRRTPIVEAVRKTRASIVSLTVEKRGSWGRNDKSVGTGVIVDGRGIVVSNRHIVAGASHVIVTLEDETKLAAQVLAEDSASDLAVLRVSAGRPLAALAVGSGSDLLVGETVIAIGHPFGYANSVSTGIISGLGRRVVMPEGEILTQLIQTDARINPGNSGGPLLNINGEFIGLNVAWRTEAQGIAFAINADTIQQVLGRELSAVRMAGVEHGITWAVTSELNAEAAPRLEIQAVAPGSPADQAGLRPGDVLLSVGAQVVRHGFDVERALWDSKPGDRVAVAGRRKGQEAKFTLVLAAAARLVQNPAKQSRSALAGWNSEDTISGKNR